MQQSVYYVANMKLRLFMDSIFYRKYKMYNKKTQDESQLIIKRARLDSVKIFEVTDSELEIIAKGSPNSIYLNFAIFLLSIATSSLITLLSVKIESITILCIFLITCALGFLLGVLLLILWYRNRNDFTKIITKIRDRLKRG